MIGDPMGRELARLGPELRDIGVPIIIAGGYGLFLKQDRAVRTGARTLREVPAQRTTQDIDLLLTADVVVDAGRMKALRKVLDRLGFTVKPGCEYFQFEREVEITAGLTRKVSIDLIAPVPPDRPGDFRVRARGFPGLHAHANLDTVAVDERLVRLAFAGEETFSVFVPNTFSFAMMKLCALHDRLDDNSKQLGRYHAFDLYRILALTTLPEWQDALAIRDAYLDTDPVVRVRSLRARLFADRISPGTLRLREHIAAADIDVTAIDIDGFLEDLQELFPE